MMQDLISRQAAIDALKHNQDVYSHNFHDDPIDKYTTAIIAADIDSLINLPSAQLERNTGKWEFIGDNMFECTSCGVVYTTRQLNGLRNYDTDPYAPKFCPNCGADMRGG